MKKPCVLVFAGNDPGGGAGIAADITAIAAQGAHALPVITALTVQDNDHVFAVHPVDTGLMLEQAQVVVNKIPIHAIKIGIVGNQQNATALATWLHHFKQQHPHVPIIVDPVLASGHGDALVAENPVAAVLPLLRVASLVTPNLPEAAQLCPNKRSISEQAHDLMTLGAPDILIKGGHEIGQDITNSWFHHDQQKDWKWPRFDGEFHGSGCTLASAIAGQLACGQSMQAALESAQIYCQRALHQAFSISEGQLIPQR